MKPNNWMCRKCERVIRPRAEIQPRTEWLGSCDACGTLYAIWTERGEPSGSPFGLASAVGFSGKLV